MFQTDIYKPLHCKPSETIQNVCSTSFTIKAAGVMRLYQQFEDPMSQALLNTFYWLNICKTEKEIKGDQ